MFAVATSLFVATARSVTPNMAALLQFFVTARTVNGTVSARVSCRRKGYELPHHKIVPEYKSVSTVYLGFLYWVR